MNPEGHGPRDDTPRRTRKTWSAGRPATPTHLEGRVDRAPGSVCLHLESGGVVYELIGAPTELVAGRHVTVAGHVDRTVSSQCGRGVPFIVTSPAPPPDSGG